RTFEASEGAPRHLADRLIEAMAAGHALGGDARRGETQSAAVIVADPREGMARRQDGLTVQINVCEHPEPIAEMRRIYETISERLGFRTLQQEVGRDVLQLKLMLHALGYLRPEETELPTDEPTSDLYTQEAVDAVGVACIPSNPGAGSSASAAREAPVVSIIRRAWWTTRGSPGRRSTARTYRARSTGAVITRFR